jgi:hyperosmotically inducible periplasmic protein
MNHTHDVRTRRTTLLLSVAATALLLPLSASAGGGYGSDAKSDKSMQEQTRDMAEKASDAASDVRMHLALEAKLAKSDELSAIAINTDVKDGIAHLKGDVQTDTQRQMATEVAKSVEGIRSVKNELRVTGEDPSFVERVRDGAGDAALTARVKSRLLLSENTSGLAINVDTDDDVVILSGEVESEAEAELAELIAANTVGVEEVRNNLRIDND